MSTRWAILKLLICLYPSTRRLIWLILWLFLAIFGHFEYLHFYEICNNLQCNFDNHIYTLQYVTGIQYTYLLSAAPFQSLLSSQIPSLRSGGSFNLPQNEQFSSFICTILSRCGGGIGHTLLLIGYYWLYHHYIDQKEAIHPDNCSKTTKICQNIIQKFVFEIMAWAPRGGDRVTGEA